MQRVQRAVARAARYCDREKAIQLVVMNSRYSFAEVREALDAIEPGACAECGHLHFLGPGLGYCACPIEGCDCQGQQWAIDAGLVEVA